MNLITTFINANYKLAKFKGAQMIIEKKNLVRSEVKSRKRIPCVVMAETQLISSIKSQTLNKEKSFQDSDYVRTSERFLTGLETRGQPNHGRSSYKCCSVASVFS